MDKIIPISDLQTKAKKYVDQVKETEEPVVITQRGRAAAGWGLTAWGACRMRRS
jgi:PHD/YefM family antitoxin component YafN of YafNO toxin-antitoxin module